MALKNIFLAGGEAASGSAMISLRVKLIISGHKAKISKDQTKGIARAVKYYNDYLSYHQEQLIFPQNI